MCHGCDRAGSGLVVYFYFSTVFNTLYRLTDVQQAKAICRPAASRVSMSLNTMQA